VELLRRSDGSMSTERDDQEYPEAGGSSADGSASPGKCDSAGAEAASTKPSEFGPVMEFIDGILIADEQARRSSDTRHGDMAADWQERPQASVGEPRYAVMCGVANRNWAGARRLSYPGLRLGCGAQVDWYEAMAEIGGEMRKVYGFSMRSMASGGRVHVAYYHATQQAFWKPTSGVCLLRWGLPVAAL